MWYTEIHRCAPAITATRSRLEPSAVSHTSPVSRILERGRKCKESRTGSTGTIMRIALYQPDIPQNTGTIMRLAACLAVPLDIIEPCGFTLSNTRLRRAGMDYAARATVNRHESWQSFLSDRHAGRLVLSTTKGDHSLEFFRFKADDILLFGSESSGVPGAVHLAASSRVRVPLAAGERSLNVAVCAGIVLWEAWRQTSSAAGRNWC